MKQNWKWIYPILQTSRRGKNYPLRRKSLEESAVQELIECQNYPKKSRNGLKITFLSDLPIKLDQAIQKRRKRFLKFAENNQRRKIYWI